MLFLKILGFALLIIIALIIFFLVTPMTVSVKYTPQKSKIGMRIGFIWINLDKSGKKRRIKKQSLKKQLKKKNEKAHPSVTFEKTLQKLQSTDSKHVFTQKPAQEKTQDTQSVKTNEAPKSNVNSSFASQSTSLLEDLIDALKIIHPTEVIKLFTKTLSDIKEPFGKYAKIKIKRLEISVASEDAAKTAIMYGVVCIAYDQLIDVASEFSVMRIKEKNCSIYYDFAAEQSYANAHIKLSISPIRAIPIVLKVYNNISEFKI